MQKYYIGLDIGTDSVGWAVTDDDYNLLKARGHDMWGSYLFEEAESAEARRQHRTARRRQARARQRILLLQSLFADEMSKVDELFFLRLNNSPLFMEDKNAKLRTANVLFDDKAYKDKDYFAQYPTIYHLRGELVKKAPDDLRKLYIAIHHIIKNRGHFLFEAQTFNINNEENIREIFYQINAFLAERDMSELELFALDDALRVMRDKTLKKRDKCKRLNKIFAVGKNKQQQEMVKAIAGESVKLKELYDREEGLDDIKEFAFDKATFEESDLPAMETALGEDDAALVHYLKAAYDWSVLCGIMNNCKYISLAKVNIYEKHKSDLSRLKKYVRENCGKDTYKVVFRHIDKVNNYAAYIGMDKQKGYCKCSKEKFYAFLKKEIKITDKEILRDIDNGDFLPKQVSNANGVIPYQLNLQELDAILENAKESFPFLAKEENGTSVADKIRMLMTFRIPYYVGPLNNDGSRVAWAVRKEGKERVSVTPWNFNEVIDKDASEQEFIRRTTNKCTYLVGEDVLPACSLLYSEFTFLNELNNLRINGEKDAEAKALIYEYAKTHKRITLKNIVSLLIRHGKLPVGSKAEEVLSGTDGDFKTSLAPWVDLQFLGDRLNTHREMCEEIILWITLISDKKRLETRIRGKYGEILDETEIKRLKNLNYSQWGRLSEKMLNDITSPKCADENGELLTVIDAMRVTGENFMQLMSGKYGFQKAVDDYNAENTPDGKVTYSTVKELYCSPLVKRAIWRSIELVREIMTIYKCAPHKIFVETVRKNDDFRKGQRTVSRKQQLLDLYKNIKDEERNWIDEIESTPDTKFNSDRLVMYYQQKGRSMYSGKRISLSDVFNVNVCDIEHIYPRSKIKDDSLDNRVLVFRTENMEKRDDYPISAEIRTNMTPFWTELKAQGLISDKKYARLVRNTPLTQEELADFINRQLVSTRQSTKAVIELLKKMLPDTEIVYAKAGNANDFKEKNDIVKVRELNDLHHAKDAYINIVVGNVYNTKFNHNAAVYFKQNGLDSYNLKNLFAYDIKGAWKVSDKPKILQTVSKNTCRIVRMTERGKGKLFDATIKTAGTNDRLIPLKASGAISDTSKYGGYDSAATAYFMLVKSKDKKGQPQLSLEAYPLMWEKRFPNSREAKIKFCKESVGLVEPEILIEEIKLNTLIYIDGSYAYLRGKTGDRIVLCNANQLYMDDINVHRLKTVSKYMAERKKLNKPDLLAGRDVSAENNLALYDALLEKLNSPIYSGLALQKQYEFLTGKKDAFAALSVEEQCRVLFEVLHLMQCNSVSSDFSLLGGVSNAGKNLTNKFVKDKKIKIILQSPTGYYRKIIDFKQFQ